MPKIGFNNMPKIGLIMYLCLGVCADRIKLVKVNISIQFATSRLEKFQSTTEF